MTALRPDLEALMPEPVANASKGPVAFFVKWTETGSPLRGSIPLYTATQMREAILAATERAATICDGLVYALDNGGNRYRREAEASKCAAVIRRASTSRNGEGEVLP